MVNLIRLIAIIVIGWLLYTFIRRWLASSGSSKKSSAEIGQMVRCAKCGLHIPQREALVKNDRYYCCRDHLQQDRS